MGGVCSVRRSGERSRNGEGTSSSHFDSSWDEGYAPVATVEGGGAIGLEGGVHDGRLIHGAAGRWPTLVEEHLLRLYNNDENYRIRSDGSREPLSLMELCVRSICKRLGKFGDIPPALPREIVGKLLASLTQHRALSCHALGAFRECEVTSLSLGGCRGVRNGWVRHLLADTQCGRFIVSLDLSSCTGLTDTGLSSLPALRNLESASLRHCHGLGAEATLCLANSPSLEYLSLAHCPRLDDAAVENLSGLSKLRSLDLEGCEGVTDEGLKFVCGLPSLTCLNASRCHALTIEGLGSLGQAADRLKRLNLGWCQGLTRGASRSNGMADDLRHGDDDEDDDDEDDTEEEDDNPGGVAESLEGLGEGRAGQARRRRRGSWALPPLHKLEKLCLARSGIADVGLSRLAAGSPGLKDLEVSGCLRISADGPGRLAALGILEKADFGHCRNVQSVSAGLAPCLRALNLAGTSVRDLEVQMIARKLTSLTALNLDSCDVGDSGLRALSTLTNLEMLNLADTGVTDAGMVHLYPLTRLKSLSLFFCAVTDSGLGPIVSLTGLTSLNLDTRDVGDAGMVQLKGLRLLETLDVFSASITDFGVAHGLCRMPSLTALEVCSGRLTDRGLHHLSRVKTLTRLNVSQNLNVTPAGVRHVGTLTRLRSLNLSCCNVTAASLDSLTGLVTLESLAVFGCRLGRTDLEGLRAKLPNLKVVRA